MKKHAQIRSFSLTGRGVLPLEIEVSVFPGLPRVQFVGASLRKQGELHSRINAALRGLGLSWPKGRVFIRFHPVVGKLLEEELDLPVALAVLAADGKIRFPGPLYAYGQFNLEGRVTSALSSFAILAENQPLHPVLLPCALAENGKKLGGLSAVGVDTLRDALLWLDEACKKPPLSFMPPFSVVDDNREEPLSDVECERSPRIILPRQRMAWHALCIAVAGYHSLLLIGAPGCGKTTLAKTALELRQPLTPSARLRKLQRLALTGTAMEEELFDPYPSALEIPFGVTSSQLTGTARNPAQSLLALADEGMVYLDELQQFSATAVGLIKRVMTEQNLELPMRDEPILRRPSRFLLLASMNPCPCGNYLNKDGSCRCKPGDIDRYWKRLDASMLDRFSLFVPMQPLRKEDFAYELKEPKPEDSTLFWRERVKSCQDRQRYRMRNYTQFLPYNGFVPPELITPLFGLSKDNILYAVEFARMFKLTGRGYYNMLRVARTLADWEDKEKVEQRHLAEATQYRWNKGREERKECESLR